MSGAKIAVIGWDSATFDVIRPLAQAGALPHLARLMERGGWSDLRSTQHPLSPTAWASFMTGMNPGKHGVYDFVCLHDDGAGHSQFQLSSGAHVRQPTLWARLGDAGRRVAVVNVPMTYPPAPVHGVLIAGMDTPAHARNVTHPPALLDEIEARFGPYVIDPRARGLPWQTVARFTQTYVRSLCESVQQQGEVTRHLLAGDKFDFLTVVFTAADRVQHALGHLLAGTVTPDDGIGQVYRACDAATGRILEALGDEWTILVMSDHGATSYHRVFAPNAWLAAQGYLRLRPAPRRMPFAETLAPLRRRLRRRLGQTAEGEPGLGAFLDRIIWEQTRAFAIGAFGSIYLPTRDRFRQGALAGGAAYDALCDELIAGLLALRDPQSGSAIVRAVHRRHEVYDGPYAHLAPDLLLETDDGYFVRNNLDHQQGQMVADAGRYSARSLAHTGMHTPDGILVAAGGPFAARGQQPPAHIMDLTPTILYLNGLPLPSTLDGQPLLSWLQPEYTAQQPVIWAETDAAADAAADAAYSERDAAVVAEHLRSLGYLS
jgi:predicted AlkP superfamily phosphohydrolase/phosphomutase